MFQETTIHLKCIVTLSAGHFSFHSKGACRDCGGSGYERIFLTSDFSVDKLCQTCHGKRFQEESLLVDYKGKTIADVLEMSIAEALFFFADQSSIVKPLCILEQMGMGYLTLGQPTSSLSDGEAQRVKLAKELGRQLKGNMLYVLDEPTTGLSLYDTALLLKLLDQLVASNENYFNGYTANNAVHVASVTKSIFSALIGIAIEKGNIKSIDQKVLDFFPHYTVKTGEKTIQSVTIKDMLTMTAPYKYKEEPYEKFFASDNWINAALDLLGGKRQAGQFIYSAIVGTHILSGILVKATGQSVFDFATENLFAPLEIHVGHNVVLHNKEEHIAFFEDKNANGWVVDPQGVNTAGFGLTLTPRDMAKIGQLFLDRGIWKDKQIVPAWWIDESTKEHSRCSQWGNLPYGYLWWIIDDKEHIYAAMGDGGNVIYVNVKKNMVISIASLFVPRAKDRIKLIKEYIEPMFENCV